LRHKADDQTMRCELLSDENADLNRQAMSNQLRIEQLNAELGQKQADLNKLNDLKSIHLNVNEVKELNRRLDLELRDKSDLVDQLNRAKDFLETTNSQLLLKNVKMQLYLEDMGMSVEQGLGLWGPAGWQVLGLKVFFKSRKEPRVEGV
jgi:hypothetical protein